MLHKLLQDNGVDCLLHLMDFGSSFFRIVANIWGEKIARIGYGLAANHAFIDGNKRIGAMITQLLLQYNGYHLSLQENELADMFIAIAAGSASEKDLLNWVKERI